MMVDHDHHLRRTPGAGSCPHDPLCPAGCEATPAPPGPAPPPVRLESLDEGAVGRSIRPVPGTVRKLGRNRGVRPENAGDSASQTEVVLHRVRRIRRLSFYPQCRPTPAVIQRKLGPIRPLAQGESWVPAFAGMTAGGVGRDGARWRSAHQSSSPGLRPAMTDERWGVVRAGSLPARR